MKLQLNFQETQSTNLSAGRHQNLVNGDDFQPYFKLDASNNTITVYVKVDKNVDEVAITSLTQNNTAFKINVKIATTTNSTSKIIQFEINGGTSSDVQTLLNAFFDASHQNTIQISVEESVQSNTEARIFGRIGDAMTTNEGAEAP